MPRMNGYAMMAALPSVLEEMEEQAAYRIYVTDALYCIGNDSRMRRRYWDLLKSTMEGGTGQAKKSGEEIANDLFARMGLIPAVEE